MKANKLIFVPIITGLIFGYHLGVIGPAIPLIKMKLILGDWEIGHIVSLFIIGLIFGALATSKVLKYMSRQKALVVFSVFLILQSIYGYFAHSFYTILIYRFICGFITGVMATLGPMIAVENSGSTKRARLTSFFQMSIALGVGICFGLGLFFHTVQQVNILFFIASILGIAGVYCFSKLPSLKQPIQNSHYGFKTYKRSYLIALGLNFFQQASGINAITFFIQTLLSERLSSADGLVYLLPIILIIVSISSTLLMTTRIESTGRKPFLLIGALGMSLSMGVLGSFQLSVWAQFFTLIVFSACFAASFGPLTYLLSSEVFPDSLRAKGASLSFFTNCLTNYFISLIFLPLRHHLGASSMWFFFGAISLCAFVFVWKLVPETAHQKTQNIVKKLK
jgi:MFS family permease